MQPKVSVIIPVYNTEIYLNECLNSIINQTLENIEIICIDDGSADNSLNILNGFKQKDSRIKVFTQENAGPGIARNKGISIATGEFICFIDSDDYYPSKYTLEHLYNAAKANEALICGGSLFELRNGIVNPNSKKLDKNYLFQKNEFINYSDYQFEYGYTRFIYNRKFILENNLYLPDYLRFQDPPFFVKAMILAKRFYALKEPTYIYRVGHKNINWTLRKAQDLVRGLTDVLNLSAKNNLAELHYRCATRRLKNKYLTTHAFNLLPADDQLLINMLNAIDMKLIHKLDPNYVLPKYRDELSLKRVSIINKKPLKNKYF